MAALGPWEACGPCTRIKWGGLGFQGILLPPCFNQPPLKVSQTFPLRKAPEPVDTWITLQSISSQHTFINLLSSCKPQFAHLVSGAAQVRSLWWGLDGHERLCGTPESPKEESRSKAADRLLISC